jgi:hypothetical protein
LQNFSDTTPDRPSRSKFLMKAPFSSISFLLAYATTQLTSLSSAATHCRRNRRIARPPGLKLAFVKTQIFCNSRPIPSGWQALFARFATSVGIRPRYVTHRRRSLILIDASYPDCRAPAFSTECRDLTMEPPLCARVPNLLPTSCAPLSAQNPKTAIGSYHANPSPLPGPTFKA